MILESCVILDDSFIHLSSVRFFSSRDLNTACHVMILVPTNSVLPASEALDHGLPEFFVVASGGGFF